MTLVLLSLVLAGVTDLLYKRAQIDGVRPASFMVFQGSFHTVAAWTVALLTGFVQFTPAVLVYAPIGALHGFLFSILLMKSLRHGDASVNIPLFKLSFLLTAAAAIALLGEPLTLGKALALGLAALAVLTFASFFGSGHRALRRDSLPSLVGAIGFSAGFAFIQKLAVSTGTPALSYMPFQSSCYLVISGAFATATGSLGKGGAGMRFAPVCGVLYLVATLLLVMSLETGDASVNVPIVQMSFILTSALAMLTLGEPANRRKLAGIVLAGLAILTFVLLP